MWNKIKALLSRKVEEAPAVIGAYFPVPQINAMDLVVAKGNGVAARIRQEYVDRQAQFNTWKDNNAQLYSLTA